MEPVLKRALRLSQITSSVVFGVAHPMLFAEEVISLAEGTGDGRLEPEGGGVGPGGRPGPAPIGRAAADEGVATKLANAEARRRVNLERYELAGAYYARHRLAQLGSEVALFVTASGLWLSSLRQATWVGSRVTYGTAGSRATVDQRPAEFDPDPQPVRPGPAADMSLRGSTAVFLSAESNARRVPDAGVAMPPHGGRRLAAVSHL
jgi:hypothetical protein